MGSLTALTGKRTFVGFGFGAIQSGLFLYEAFHSGAFGRLVVAEVVPEVVSAVRQAGERYAVNIAHPDRVESAQIGPVEIYNPAVEADRQRLIEAVGAAEEIATAVPSVAFYASENPGSIHRIIAEGLRLKAWRGGPPAVIYAAENHNHAAEILAEQVIRLIPEEQRAGVGATIRFLNTVIGKMSQVVTDPAEVSARGLTAIAPGLGRAFLVESFNRILISKVQFPEPFERGIAVFQEKNDLLPFEEAKLYGHNATHALIGYLGAVKGLQRVADLNEIGGALALARAAFIEESGAALIRKYGGVDALFTPEGYRQYADDLLARMLNPFLADSIERVTRDTARKLGWNDRLIGTIRLAMSQGIPAKRYSLGAAAALATLENRLPDAATRAARLLPLWREAAPDEKETAAVLAAIEQGCRQLEAWYVTD